MKIAKVFSLILGVLFLVGCASTACKYKTPANETTTVVPVAAIAEPVKPAVVSEPAPGQDEPEMKKIPAAVLK